MLISVYLSIHQIFTEGQLYAKHSAKLWSFNNDFKQTQFLLSWTLWF